ncbi:hypothetical protein GJR96_07440 [Haloferax sp. MBLA0076]|uniref:DUF5518 domain-containing protein n=1 Tax=Haloferax litoreum TaxID=2666140 RepID=A0A6A8GF57_9EURY|nr:MULTISPECIES: DUF5518 domain-containing protein [Haloferax]KAB1193287.1 hypothetical protein Hfx1148_07435 [Haloferax sp. CBA1148]MRX21788.1 hypothetical protein [Haloferax litoreum]
MEHSTSPSSSERSLDERESSIDEDGESLLFSAIVGAIASIVLSPLPGSTILGGALAGYLTGTDRDVGVKSGALSGLFVSLIAVLLGFVVLAFFSIFAIAAPRAGFGLGLLGLGIVVLVGLGVVLLYTVGLGALGGYLGAYLHEEFQ